MATLVEAIEAEREAIARVDNAATLVERETLLAAIHSVATSQSEVFCDDIWQACPSGFSPREPRLLGAILKRAQKLGWIVPTNENRVSRISVNGNPARSKKVVWRSLLHD